MVYVVELHICPFDEVFGHLYTCHYAIYFYNLVSICLLEVHWK